MKQKQRQNKKRVSLNLDIELYKKFKLWCVENDKTFSGGIEYLIAEFLKNSK